MWWLSKQELMQHKGCIQLRCMLCFMQQCNKGLTRQVDAPLPYLCQVLQGSVWPSQVLVD